MLQLRACLKLMEENEPLIAEALKADVGKPKFEATFTEIVPVQTEIRSMLDEIDHWMKPTHYSTPAALLPGSSYVMRDPYGVVLIIAPFNYPIQLTMLPLIAAISAGACSAIADRLAASDLLKRPSCARSGCLCAVELIVAFFFVFLLCRQLRRDQAVRTDPGFDSSDATAAAALPRPAGVQDRHGRNR